MILSDRYGFVFIKTTKTAGTSIEVDLSRRVEPEAIVTPILPAVVGHEPRNFNGPTGSTFYNHMPASRVRSLIGNERYSRLFSFCVEREPVAKCISHFHMLHVRGQATTWDAYVENGEFPIDLAKYTEATPDGLRIMVSRVLRYETLAEELPAVMDKLGLPDFVLASRAKSEFSRNRLVKQADVTDDQRETILKAFRPTLLVHGLYPEAL